MKPKGTLRIARAAMIAAAYIGLVAAFPFLSFGAIQFRIAEALTILPFFWPEAIFGVTIGCLVSNILWGLGVVDIVFGTSATLIAALLTWWLGKSKKIWLGAIPPIVINAIVVGFYLPALLLPTTNLSGFQAFSTIFQGFTLAAFAATGGYVAIGEFAVLAVLGVPLAYALNKRGLLEQD